jgi:23S rRNA (cytidine1920-2'-O)/16S rRNA (cytidine1409-2'-O)-methyltransferase
LSPKKRARFVALQALLRQCYPDLERPESWITEGRVLVDGAVISNSRALVRASASIKLQRPVELRGARKLDHAILHLALDLRGKVAVDIGASAGGFTEALLRAGIVRVYAVDAGFGQLRGHLRADPRVVNLERTNVSDLDNRQVPEMVDVVTIDVSYLALADAARQLGGLRLAPQAKLLALVKPTYELRAGKLAASDGEVASAVASATSALGKEGWRVEAVVASPILGRSGAVEKFIYAARRE